MSAEDDDHAARRKGMRKGGALTAAAVCERLGCSRTELDRWAADGRLPPDGELFLRLAKRVNARAWLPAKVEGAKAKIADWRAQDKVMAKLTRRKPGMLQ